MDRLGMKTFSRLSSQRYAALVLFTIVGASIFGCSTSGSSEGVTKGNVTERMQLVVDNLVQSYNTLDSVNFRRHFGASLLVEVPLSITGQLLRDSQTENGKLEKVDIEASADGLSADLTLHFEKRTLESSLKLDFNGRMTLLDWLSSN